MEQRINDVFKKILLNFIASHYMGKSSEFGLPLPNMQGFDSSALMGQIAGVTTDKQGNIYVFHRADRAWDQL